MLLELIFNLCFAPMEALMSLGSVVNLPLEAVAVLADISVYGCWVLGADFFLTFLGVVFGFFTLRVGISFIEWVWHLIPLC